MDIWNIAEGKHLVAWKPHANKVEWCGFVDEDRVLTLGDSKLILWKLPSLKAEYVVDGYRGKPCFSANRKHLLLVNGTALRADRRRDRPASRPARRPGRHDARALAVGRLRPRRQGIAVHGAYGHGQPDRPLGPVERRLQGGHGRQAGAGECRPALGRAQKRAGRKHAVQLGPQGAHLAICAARARDAAAGGPDGRHWFAFGTGKEGPSVLAAQTIPDAAASQLAKLVQRRPGPATVPPGTKFQLAVNGFNATQNDIIAAATNHLKNAGYSAGAGGVTINITAQENATGKFLDYEIRKVGKFGLPKGGKQMIKVAEKKVACQLTISDAAGAILEKPTSVSQRRGRSPSKATTTRRN